MALKAVVEKDVFEGFSEDLKAEYTEKDGKYVLSTPEGFKPMSEFTVVHSALAKERTDHKKVKDALGAFGDLKPDEVREKLARIPELEAAAEGKLDDKKLDELVGARIASKLAPIERERDQLKVKNTELMTENEGFKTQNRTRSIHDAVRTAARSTKILASAEDDALMYAERMFEVQADGIVVTKDNIGITPGLTPELWLKDMSEKKPHWWGPSQGGGARNGGGSGNIVENPFSHEHWNMTKQGEMVKADPAKADRYAKAAGTTVGGRKPEPKG